MCRSKRNRLLIKKAGGFPLLARLIKSRNISLLIPVIGTLQECAAEKSYCMAIQAEGMVEDFVSNLLNDNMELRKHCASAIFKCAQEEETRALVKSNGGLEPLVALIKNNENHGNKVTFSMHTHTIDKDLFSKIYILILCFVVPHDLLYQLYPCWSCRYQGHHRPA